MSLDAVRRTVQVTMTACFIALHSAGLSGPFLGLAMLGVIASTLVAQATANRRSAK